MNAQKSIQNAIHQWRKNPFTHDSREASQWFCKQVDGFEVVEVLRCMPDGAMSRFAAASNGVQQIRLIEDEEYASLRDDREFSFD